MGEGYRIVDEPSPGALAHLAVRPFWPLLGLMLAGFWLALPWAVLNSFATGSPTRGRELATAVLGLVGAFGLAAFVLFAAEAGWIEGRLQVRLALLGVLVWKLAISYWLVFAQTRTFELHEHFGGVVRNGMLVVLAGWYFGPRILAALDLPVLVALALR